jgi:hypothetical protein
MLNLAQKHTAPAFLFLDVLMAAAFTMLAR